MQIEAVTEFVLPEGMELEKELGRGSNNRAYRALWNGTECVLRVPRRRSDTQQRESALWEFKQTQRAGELEAGPRVLAGWYARHASDEWTSGLYMITECFDSDLESLLCHATDHQSVPPERRQEAEEAIADCVRRLAADGLFVFDLKPSNVVINSLEGEGPVKARIIDYGRDFCEWTGCPEDPTAKTTVLTMLDKRTHGDEKRVCTVIYCAMLALLSSMTTQVLYEERAQHRMDERMRYAVHPVRRSFQKIWDEIRDADRALVRHVLRCDDVRGVLRHYHGRRNSGTEYAIQTALGVERPTRS